MFGNDPLITTPRFIPRNVPPPATADTGVSGAARAAAAPVVDRALDERGIQDRAGSGEMSDREAFSRLDREMRRWVEGIVAGIGNIPVRYTVKSSINYLRQQVVPMLRQMLSDATSRANLALAQKRSASRDQAIKMAGTRYQAAMIVAEVIQAQVNLFIVSGYGDTEGVPTRTITDNLARFEQRVLPLLEAAVSFDLDVIRVALARSAADRLLIQEELARALTDIRGGAILSQKVIKVADILMLALSAYQIYRTPAVGGPPSSGSGPPRMMLAYAGGAVASRHGTIEITTAFEAIKKLVQIGAIDPTIASLLAASMGTPASPIPELGRPTITQSSPAGGGAAPKPKAAAVGEQTPSSGASGKSPAIQIPSKTLVKLSDLRINTKDPYTIDKLTEIYLKNRNPEALLMQARAGTGELRVLMRSAREPGVKSVRFLRPTNIKGDFTPDIEVSSRNGKTTFIEVRTMTQASPPLKVQDAKTARRSRLAATDEFVNDLERKIRHGQLSANRPGRMALHAPFQNVTAESLDGWRDVINRIRARGEIPTGISRIEITGGTGPMLVFEGPHWKGLIVK